MTLLYVIAFLLFISLSAQYSFEEFEESDNTGSMIVHPDLEERIEFEESLQGNGDIPEVIIVEED